MGFGGRFSLKEKVILGGVTARLGFGVRTGMGGFQGVGGPTRFDELG
jgi:hypothetical protein